MEQSLFIEWVKKYFPGITVSVVETLNGTTRQPTYLHRRMLRKNFSVNGKWEGLSAAYSLVAADVIAMDSSLPLKARDAISRASGDIPKMGMELQLNEQQLTNLDVLVAQNAPAKEILTKLFADVPKVIGGIYERNEAIFLEGLSTGLCVVDDTETVGTGIRLDFGYYEANMFGVAGLWSSASTATPFDDLQKLTDRASLDGNRIIRFMLDKATFNNLAKCQQTKDLFAFFQGFVGATIPVPSLTQINQVAQDRFGFTFEIVDRTVKLERNGVQTTVRPWATGAIIGICNEITGDLVYARLAEQNHPVANVSYNTVDDFILVSKYRQNKPSLSEYTSSQARVVPVISNVAQIYKLDTLTVQA